MECANPHCRRLSDDLQSGILRLMELDVPPEARVTQSEWGFPILAVPSRFFWLCADCSQVMVITKWTVNGLTFSRHDRQPLGKLPVARFAQFASSAALHPKLIRKSA